MNVVGNIIVWFNPRSVHFAGKLSNFYKDIEIEETPQLTNNPSETLNSVLKSIYHVGYLNKDTMAEGLQQFYHKKHRHLNSFLDTEKKKNGVNKTFKSSQKWKN